jgi:hypothetical protein
LADLSQTPGSPSGRKAPTVEADKQAKHAPGHNTTKSTLTYPGPQKLADKFAGKGQQVGQIPVGQPGSRERFNAGEFIGECNGVPTTLSITRKRVFILFLQILEQ